MNINRNNYEEYFLLYADNELSPAEKNEVEIFVQQHFDLEEEFNMIKLAINFPDKNVSMPDKSLLMKNESSSFINENNYEEIFILYNDDELSIEQENETKKFVKLHPQFNIEFELIGKSKLTYDEAIVYPDKKQLYKKEKVGRVIPLILWRYLAAAVFIGFGIWIALSYFNQKEGMRAVAFDGNPIKLIAPTAQKAIPEKLAEKENVASTSMPKTELTKRGNNENNLKEKQMKIISEHNENTNAIVKTNVKIKTLAEEKAIQIKQDYDRKIIVANNPVKKTPDEIERTKTPLPANEIAQHIDKIDENIQPSMHVQNASYVVDNNGSDENYIFYNVKTEEFNKSKVGGFLKKVKRIIERNNPISRLIGGEEKQVASN